MGQEMAKKWSRTAHLQIRPSIIHFGVVARYVIDWPAGCKAALTGRKGWAAWTVAAGWP
jgi:hypothetical protein